jgi:hypothetical protein
MNRMPTKAAEDIYSVLQRYAEASPKHYDRELFIYNFGVVPNPSKKFKLNCMDGKYRTFIKDGDNYMLKGHGDSKINTIINKILSDAKSTQEIDDLK